MGAQTEWPVLSGDGFVLRPLSTRDARPWHAGEDEEQRRWFEFPGPAPIENVVAAIDAWRSSWENDGPVRHWGIWVQPDETLVGGVEIRDRGDRRANVSYVVFPPARRRRIATRAVHLASTWAFGHLPIDAVVAIIHEDNIASRGVAEASGFSSDGIADPSEYSETGPMLRYVLIRPGRA